MGDLRESLLAAVEDPPPDRSDVEHLLAVGRRAVRRRRVVRSATLSAGIAVTAAVALAVSVDDRPVGAPASTPTAIPSPAPSPPSPTVVPDGVDADLLRRCGADPATDRVGARATDGMGSTYVVLDAVGTPVRQCDTYPDGFNLDGSALSNPVSAVASPVDVFARGLSYTDPCLKRGYRATCPGGVFSAAGVLPPDVVAISLRVGDGAAQGDAVLAEGTWALRAELAGGFGPGMEEAPQVLTVRTADGQALAYDVNPASPGYVPVPRDGPYVPSPP